MTDTEKKSKATPLLFFVFVVLSLIFGWIQYAVPLDDHVVPSVKERLKASKESFRRTPGRRSSRQRQNFMPNDTQKRSTDSDMQSLEHSKTNEGLNPEYSSASRTTTTDNTSNQRPDYHIVFSTSCSEQQNWESFVFFYHAYKVQQPGNVTRIASACSAREAKEQIDFFNKFIAPMNPGNFHLHLTPDYGKVALAHGHYYKYMNKREFPLGRKP